MNTHIAISDARANLPDLIARINTRLDRAVITVNGKPKVVMLSVDEFESLEETAKVQAIPRIKDAIKKSRLQIKKGEFVRLSDLS